MENATKALIIAAGMLLAIMILSLLTISYNNLTDYLNQDEKIKEVEQITRFNSQFENYNRKDVRGSDILSLVSKIKDYIGFIPEKREAGTFPVSLIKRMSIKI